jgi:Flp pilus assembly protein CpaB
VLIGSLVLVASALAAGLLYANLGDRQPVLAVARAVEAGQVVEAGDLRQILVAPVPGVRMVPASSRRAMVGRTASVRLLPGSLLNPAQLTTGPLVDPDRAVVGALLKPGQFPVGLRVGDDVLAVVLAPEGAPVDDTALPVPPRARVAAIEQSAEPGAGLAISLAVEPGDATLLATAGARGRLTLVLAPR